MTEQCASLLLYLRTTVRHQRAMVDFSVANEKQLNHNLILRTVTVLNTKYLELKLNCPQNGTLAAVLQGWRRVCAVFCFWTRCDRCVFAVVSVVVHAHGMVACWEREPGSR